MKHPSLFQSLLLKGPKALNYMSGSECIFPNAWESAGCLIPLPGCRWGTPTTALLSHSTGVGYGDINVWCSTGTRTEQTSEEAAPARPLQEEIEETTKEQEENIRDGYTASHALAQIPATWGEQLSFWTFSPNFHNSLLFHSAAEQSLPFSSVPWGSFPHPHFHLWKHKALKPRTQISHLKRKKSPSIKRLDGSSHYEPILQSPWLLHSTNVTVPMSEWSQICLEHLAMYQSWF